MKEDIKDLAIDYAEIMLDSELQESLVEEFPVVKTLYKLGKITASVPEMIFASKIRRFLSSVDSHSEKNREKIKESIASDPKKQNWLVEVTTLSIQQTDRLEKCELLGVIFVALLDGVITEEEFSGLYHAVLKSDVVVLKAFVKEVREFQQKNGKLLKIGYESLIASNLTRGTGTMSPDASGTFTRPTELGLSYLKVIDTYLDK